MKYSRNCLVFSVHFHGLDSWQCHVNCYYIADMMTDPLNHDSLLVACLDRGIYVVKSTTTRFENLCRYDSEWAVTEFQTAAGSAASLNASFLVGVDFGLSPTIILVVSGCALVKGDRATGSFQNILSTEECGQHLDGDVEVARVNNIKAMTRGPGSDVYFIDTASDENKSPLIRGIQFIHPHMNIVTLEEELGLQHKMIEYVYNSRREWAFINADDYYFKVQYNGNSQSFEFFNSSNTTIRDGPKEELIFPKSSDTGMSRYKNLVLITSFQHRTLRIFDADPSTLTSLCIDSNKTVPGPIGVCQMYTSSTVAPHLVPRLNTLFYAAAHATDYELIYMSRFHISVDTKGKS